jgi:hypothetical protein
MGTVQIMLVDNTDEAHGCYLVAEPQIEVTTAQLPDTVDHDGLAYHHAGYSGSAPVYLSIYRPGPLPTNLVERTPAAYVDELGVDLDLDSAGHMTIETADVAPGWL